jgi:uncharacterized membrane protein required for colicin V production
MLAIVLILIFAYAYFIGYRRGFALQLLYTFSYLISYMIASSFYQQLGEKIYLWIPYPNPTQDTNMIFFDRATSFLLSRAFYAGTAFLIIYFACCIAVRLIGLLAHKLNDIALFGTANRILGGAFSVLVSYLTVLMVLVLASMVPINAVQNALSGDVLTRAMIERTPFFSDNIRHLWIDEIIHQPENSTDE